MSDPNTPCVTYENDDDVIREIATPAELPLLEKLRAAVTPTIQELLTPEQHKYAELTGDLRLLRFLRGYKNDVPAAAAVRSPAKHARSSGRPSRSAGPGWVPASTRVRHRRPTSRRSTGTRRTTSARSARRSWTGSSRWRRCRTPRPSTSSIWPTSGTRPTRRARCSTTSSQAAYGRARAPRTVCVVRRWLNPAGPRRRAGGRGRAAQIMPKEFLKVITHEMYMEWQAYHMEFKMLKLHQASHERKRLVRAVIVKDLEGYRHWFRSRLSCCRIAFLDHPLFFLRRATPLQAGHAPRLPAHPGAAQGRAPNGHRQLPGGSAPWHSLHAYVAADSHRLPPRLLAVRPARCWSAPCW